MRINLTQHEATPVQGCEPRSLEQTVKIRGLLTFDELPTLSEVMDRATELANIATESGADEAMIGGASYLTLILDPELRLKGVQPLYAFTKREVIEVPREDGSTVKKSVFRHLGFVKF